MLRYYAIQWTYGRACDDRGDRIGHYHSFVNAAQRQRWIQASRTSYPTQAGFRQAIPARDSELRRIIRHDHCATQIEHHDYVPTEA